MVSVSVQSVKRKTFSTTSGEILLYLTPESAFALNYFINNTLCKMEIPFFFKCCILKNQIFM